MPKYTCVVCQEGFVSYNKNPKFCSLSCKGDYQAPQINITELQELYESGKTQTEVAHQLGISQKSVHKAMKRHGLIARVAKKRNQYKENNDSWKGDAAGYAAFHKRLYALHGKPIKCSICGTTESKNYDYANLTGRYHDPEDFVPMCRSCHWKHDEKIMNIKHMAKKLGGKKSA